MMTEKPPIEHFTVYMKPGRYGGWPANYGMWCWDQEMMLIFIEGAFEVLDTIHSRDRSKPFVTLQSRSLDGGRTWETGSFPGRVPGDKVLSGDEHQVSELQIGDPYAGVNPPVPFTGELDFTQRDFALLVGRNNMSSDAQAVSWFYISRDRCRSWEGPYRLPDFGLSGIAGRTDVITYGPQHALFMLTAQKSDGTEGRVFCAETRDGCRTFAFKSWIGLEPEGYAIMPSSVRLDDGRLLTAIRCRGGKDGARPHGWIDLYESVDDGGSWKMLDPLVTNSGEWGNPAAMLKLADGRLCMTYGYRFIPGSMRGRISEDGGQSWSDDIILREGSGDQDMGYPRAVVRGDGKVVTAYYWNDRTDGERYIAATIWDV